MGRSIILRTSSWSGQDRSKSAIVLLSTGWMYCPATSANGKRVNLRSCRYGCGIVRPGSSIISLLYNKMSISSVRGPHFIERCLPNEVSILSISVSNSEGERVVLSATTILRKSGWSVIPHALVSYMDDLLEIVPQFAPSNSMAFLNHDKRSPSLLPKDK